MLNNARKLPPIITLISSIVFFLMSALAGGSIILASLAELSLTISIFLGLIAWFNAELEISKVEEDPLEDVEETGEIEETNTNTDTTPDLIEIKKDDPAPPKENKKTLSAHIAEFLYIAIFTGIGLWRTSRLLPLNLMPNLQRFNHSFVDVVVMLGFSCVFALYLKLRKNNNDHLGDKTSNDMLTIFSCILLINAVALTLYIVLGMGVALTVLPWLFYLATVYIIIAMLANLVLSIIKKEVFANYNYTLLPNFSISTPKLLDQPQINKNFSIKSLYTITYTLKILPTMILALGAILFASTSIFVVQPHQQGAVYHFGSLERTSIVGEGIHFKLPWPIQTVAIYDVHRLNSMQIGFTSSHSHHNLWTQTHDGGENLLLLGNGNELVAINTVLVYHISDLYSFITNHANPQAMLYAAAYQSLLQRTKSATLDDFLSVDRSSLSHSIRDELTYFSQANGLGISVVEVVTESIHPPVEIAEIYQRVVTAALERNTIITNAQTQANTTLIYARKQSQLAIDNAHATQHTQIGNATRDMAVFYAAMEAYGISPASFRLIRQLDAYQHLIANSTTYVFSQGMENSIGHSILGQQSNAPLWLP